MNVLYYFFNMISIDTKHETDDHLSHDCPFCDFIRGKGEYHKIYETDKLLAFLSNHPLEEGHILIIPKYHGEQLHNIPDKYLRDIMPLASKMAEVVFASKSVDYNILQNNGTKARQRVKHVHFHIVPKIDEKEGLILHGNCKKLPREKMEKIASNHKEQLSKVL